MDFNLTEEQVLLRQSVARFLREHYGFEARRSATGSAEGWRPAIWSDFAGRLGLLGLGVPATLGGVGGGAVEMMLVMEEMGRALVVEPFLESAIIGAPLLAASDGAAARSLLQRVLAGDARLAFAWS